MIEDGGTESSFSLGDKQSGVKDWTPPNKISSGEELIALIGGSFEEEIMAPRGDSRA